MRFYNLIMLLKKHLICFFLEKIATIPLFKYFFEDHISKVKMFLALFISIMPFLIDNKGLQISLAIIFFGSELYGNYLNSLSSLDKVKKYLADVDGWTSSGAENYEDYYSSAPEFTIKTNDCDNSKCNEEWVRGEIGYHYDIGDSQYKREIYYHQTKLKDIHIVNFDGGKKTIVAPTYEPIGRGRIYYYLQDSVEYAYQTFMSQERGKDYSKEILKKGYGSFDIPIFKDRNELEKFKRFCNDSTNTYNPSSNETEQNEIFYNLLDKYQDFIRSKTSRIRHL